TGDTCANAVPDVVSTAAPTPAAAPLLTKSRLLTAFCFRRFGSFCFAAMRLPLSFFGAVGDEDTHDELEFGGPCNIKRGTAIGVDRIHVHAEIDRQLHALEHQR